MITKEVIDKHLFRRWLLRMVGLPHTATDLDLLGAAAETPQLLVLSYLCLSMLAGGRKMARQRLLQATKVQKTGTYLEFGDIFMRDTGREEFHEKANSMAIALMKAWPIGQDKGKDT